MDGAEFREILNSAGLSETEFQIITGRHRKSVADYLNDGQQRPTLGDIVMLYFLAEHPEFKEEFIAIAKESITGDSDGNQGPPGQRKRTTKG